MTQDDRRKEALLEQGDVSADPEELSGTESGQMGANAGRGARQEPGAEASEAYIDEHISGDSAPGTRKGE
jgi:hypothetical protein